MQTQIVKVVVGRAENDSGGREERFIRFSLIVFTSLFLSGSLMKLILFDYVIFFSSF